MDSLVIALTGKEVVYLTDSILNKDIAEGLSEKEAYMPLARPLLLKLASLFTELVSETGVLPGPVDIAITEEEAWLLRTKVRSGDILQDGTPIGISLLCKLYNLLIEFNNELNDLQFGEIDEKQLTDFNRQYLKWVKEEADAGRESSENPDRESDSSP